MAKLSDAQTIVLRHIANERHVDIRKISEPYRQRAIDLGMMKPPLVDIDADHLHLTPAGRAALAENSKP